MQKNNIRSLTRMDVQQLLVIENAVHVVPWTEEAFLICIDAAYPGWAIEVDKLMVGFIFISLLADECHILNVCVAREYQHKGYGRQLIEHALNYAKQKGIGIAYLEVRRSNSRAISLYEKMNFHHVGERKNYYPTVNGHEDALIFVKPLVPFDKF